MIELVALVPIVVVCISSVVGPILVAFVVNSLRKENTSQHGDSRQVLDRIEAKVDTLSDRVAVVEHRLEQ